MWSASPDTVHKLNLLVDGGHEVTKRAFRYRNKAILSSQDVDDFDRYLMLADLLCINMTGTSIYDWPDVNFRSHFESGDDPSVPVREAISTP